MLYFIPAWYQLNEWSENEQSWMERRMHTEFDDTVKQIQLFHRSGVCPYRILLLSHGPNFRHFLHRQSVYRAPYWSCFDAIQEVKRRKAAVLSFHHLKWPEGVSFLYTPFVVVAMLEGEKYAQIDFGEDGNLIRVALYENNRLVRRNLYDDRGFLSSTIRYENEEPLYQDYLTEKGVWKLRCFKKDGHVEINPQDPQYSLQYEDEAYFAKFSRLRYDDLGQVIGEVLFTYLRLTEKEDIFCIAMHDRHTGLLAEALRGKKKILSFFSDRSLNRTDPEVWPLVRESDYVIADSGDGLRELERRFGASIGKGIAIPPYDSRVEEGLGLQLPVQKILVAIDGIEGETFNTLIGVLGEYLSMNEDVRIHLFTRRADYDRKQRVLEQVRRVLARNGMAEEWAAQGDEGKVSENNLEPEEGKSRFFVEQWVDELAVSKCMRDQRLLVDLREIPELYLQITAISFGIPQIVGTQTEFLEQGKNGRIIEDIYQLPSALHYYLSSLKNWNQARVYSYELVKEYTADKLLEKWKEVMDSVGGNSYFTVGSRGLEPPI